MKSIPILAVLFVLLVLLPVAVGQDADAEAKELVAKAQEAGKAEKFDQAIALMNKAVKLTPRNDLYIAMTSDFEYKAHQYTEGLKHALEAIKLNDNAGAYYVLAAANSFWLQDLDQARGYCDLVVKRGKELGPVSVRDVRLIQDQMGKKTFTLFFNLDPKKGRMANGALAIAMAKSGLPYQSATYEIGDVKSHKLVKGEVDDVLQVVPSGARPFALTIKITTQAYSFKKALTGAAAKPLPADAKAQLGSSVAIDPKSPTLQKVAANLKSDDTLRTARNVMDWIKKNIEYKLERKSIGELDFKSVDEIVKRGHAECRGHALLFTALCRACDVPARPIWGILRVPPGADLKYGEIVSHNWAEIYVSGAGWIPVDPQRPETLGFLPNYYMRMFMDAQKTRTSLETLPILNLMYTHDAKLRFEEAR